MTHTCALCSTAVRENIAATMKSYLSPAPVIVATTITSARRLLLQTTSAPYGVYVQVLVCRSVEGV